MRSYIDTYILGVPQGASLYGFIGRVCLFFFLLYLGTPFFVHQLDGDYINGNFLHGVNLIFHEAGHVVFGFFGTLIAAMGGSILQLLMPLIVAGTFLFQQKDGFATAVGCWWFAQNLFDLTPYIADARAGVLPLLGGNTGKHAPYGFHDWEYILTELHLLQYDVAIAWTVHWLGAVYMIIAYVWAGYALIRYWQHLDATG